MNGGGGKEKKGWGAQRGGKGGKGNFSRTKVPLPFQGKGGVENLKVEGKRGKEEATQKTLKKKSVIPLNGCKGSKGGNRAVLRRQKKGGFLRINFGGKDLLEGRGLQRENGKKGALKSPLVPGHKTHCGGGKNSRQPGQEGGEKKGRGSCGPKGGKKNSVGLGSR